MLESGAFYIVVVWQALFGDVGETSHICNGITENFFHRDHLFPVVGFSVCTCRCSLLTTIV